MKPQSKPLKTAAEATFVNHPVRVSVYHRNSLLCERVFQHTPVRIGRIEDNDVILPFDFASRYHCELRLIDGEWIVADLGSKNGFSSGGRERLREHVLGYQGEFQIQEIRIRVNTIDTAARPQPQLTGTVAKAVREETNYSIANVRMAKTFIDVNTSITARQALVPVAEASVVSFHTDPEARASREKALQMLVLWRDKVLETRDFKIGETIEWSFSDQKHELGVVKANATSIRIPKGCRPTQTHAPKASMKFGEPITVTPESATSFQVGESLYVLFRYVARSRAFNPRKAG